MEVKANNPILYKGTGTPYLAIFDNQGIPVMNPLTGIPLGAYISSWSYVYDEEKENLATITIDTGNPDTVDERLNNVDKKISRIVQIDNNHNRIEEQYFDFIVSEDNR